jgi:hypothetical protein
MSGPDLDPRLRSAANGVGLALVIALVTGGCAIPYAGIGPPNLQIKTSTGARTIFGVTNAALEIERVTPDCRGVSEGKVYLRDAPDSLHLPAGRLSNLVFSFRTSSLFWGTESTTTYTTLIRPREGFRYEVTIAYAEGLYTIDIIETATKGGPAQKLPRQDISACQRA